MATKGTNAKIKELKGVKPEKITAEQLDKIQETINTMNRAQIEIGSMELKKHEMLHQLSNIKDGLATLQQELQKEYGTVDINIQDGTINYGDVEADS
jgi:RecB family endonuclease NucS